MQPEALHNQLRFNLSEPYCLNKLSARHHKPQPIIIEKAASGTSFPDRQRRLDDEVTRSEPDLGDKFSYLSLDKMRQAQFLAQRQLKKEKLMESVILKDKAHSPKRSAQPPKQAVSKRTSKTTPKKQKNRLPVSGNSPPVRDAPTQSRRRVPFTAPKSNERARPASPSKTTFKHPPKTSPSEPVTATPARTESRGITREKPAEGSAFSMPDLHKMAIDQLIRIQQGEYVPPPPRRQKKPQAKIVKSVNKQPRYDARSPSRARARARARYLQPAVRAEAGRILRERIYRQQLHHPLPTPQRLSASEQPKKQGLPDPDSFIERVMEARRHREVSDRLALNPSQLVDNIEKEAKRRLEPLIQQAELLSRNLAESTRASRPRIHRFSPQRGDSRADDSINIERTTPRRVERTRSPPWAGPVSPDGVTSPDDESSEATTEDVHLLSRMLERLTRMQEEHLEIRRRWMATSSRHDYPNLISISDDNANEPHDVIMDDPKPMLLSRARTQCPKTVTTVSDHLQSSSTLDDEREKEADGRVSVSLPEKVVRSIENGKKRFDKHLQSTCHTVSKDFNPWAFAQEAADSIVDQCLTQVAQEIVGSGNDLIQGLYADEFISSAHTPTSPLAESPSS